MKSPTNRPRPRFLGLYGSVAIPKGFCPTCETQAFIIDNKYQCCDTYAPITPYNKYIRYSEQANPRKRPSTKYQIEQLDRQNNQCFYCGLDLREPQWNYKKTNYVMARIEWDHSIPYSFLKDNKDINFVASCSICNHIKSSKLFLTALEAREYVIKRRNKKGFRDSKELSELSGTFFHEDKEETVLQVEVPIRLLEQAESKIETIPEIIVKTKTLKPKLKFESKLKEPKIELKAEQIKEVMKRERLIRMKRMNRIRLKIGIRKKRKIWDPV